MKSETFHIEELVDGKLLIILTTYIRPEYYFDELEKILNSHYRDISVIYFDFLLKNGLKDRFFAMDLIKDKFILSSFRKARGEELIKHSNQFFAKNMDLINNSVLLSKAQKFLLKKNLKLAC